MKSVEFLSSKFEEKLQCDAKFIFVYIFAIAVTAKYSWGKKGNDNVALHEISFFIFINLN